MEQKSAFDSFELDVNNDIRQFLKETSSWSYFLSIMGFIGIGVLVIFGAFFGAIMSSDALGSSNPYAGLGFSMGYLGLVYVVLGLLYFFPIYYLLVSKIVKTMHFSAFRFSF